MKCTPQTPGSVERLQTHFAFRLSTGHSAWGNIASMLVLSRNYGVRPDPGLPSSHQRAICVFGMYNLSGPLDTWVKNKIFQRMYIKKMFGGGKKAQSAVLLANSPSKILRSKLDSTAFTRMSKCRKKKSVQGD